MKFQPLLVGGPQEEGRRAGTENVAGVLAMVAALEEREVMLARSEEITSRLAIRGDFEAQLKRDVPGLRIIGSAADRLWNTVSVLLPELPDCRQRWVVKLDKLGFAVSTGSACASGKDETSHVLGGDGFQRGRGVAGAAVQRRLGNREGRLGCSAGRARPRGHGAVKFASFGLARGAAEC